MASNVVRSHLILCWIIFLSNQKPVSSFANQNHKTSAAVHNSKKISDVRSSETTSHNDLPHVRGECVQANGKPGKCFPSESCYEWQPHLEHSLGKRWPVCEWLHEPIHSSKSNFAYLMAQPKKPLTLCCEPPALTIAKSSMRQLSRDFVEIPQRKAMLHLHEEDNNCGISFPSLQSHFHPLMSRRVGRSKRMVHGHTTKASSHPWMAAVFIRGLYAAGGSIISNRMIITASHYLRSPGTNFSDFEVMVGSTELGSGTVYRVMKIVFHPESSRKSVLNDIAILVTVKPITFSDHVNRICLPPASMTSASLLGLRASMTGFGTYDYGGLLPARLQETHVPIQGQITCSNLLLKLKVLPRGMKRANSLICTGFPYARTDACQGDSGGPLAVKMNGRSYLIGVISFGYKCNEDGYYGVSTFVTHFSPWIRNVMHTETGSRPLS